MISVFFATFTVRKLSEAIQNTNRTTNTFTHIIFLLKIRYIHPVKAKNSGINIILKADQNIKK